MILSTAHIVGLRYYLQEPLLTSLLSCTDASQLPWQNKPVYLMTDKECEQDDSAVLACDEVGLPLGHISHIEAPHVAQQLGNDITSIIEGNIIGVDATRRSLIIKLKSEVAKLQQPHTAITLQIDGVAKMNIKWPKKLADANRALTIASGMTEKYADWNDTCQRVFDNLMQTTLCDLSSETYRKRVALAEACKNKADERWKQMGDRLFALIDHMGGDELMQRWLACELPQLLADAKVQNAVNNYAEYTTQQRYDALLKFPCELGRIWLSGNKMLFAKRLYYTKISFESMLQLLVLIAMNGEHASTSLPAHAATLPSAMSKEKRITQAILDIQKKLKQKGHWLAIYRILADEGLVNNYSELANYVHNTLGIDASLLSKPINADTIGKAAISKGLPQDKSFAYWETYQKRNNIATLYGIASEFKALAGL